MEALLAHVQLQAIIHQIQEETAQEYLRLNIARNTGLISREEYSETLWELTAAAAHTEQQWEQYQQFSQLVTTLTNEYYLSFLADSDTFIDLFDIKD